MKFKSQQEDLAKAISIVSKAIKSKSSLTVLQNILIEASLDGFVKMSGTDLEMSIDYVIPANVLTEGKTTLPARTLGDLVNTFPKDTVTVSLNEGNQKVQIACGKSKSNINGIDASEFPKTTSSDDCYSIAIPYNVFKKSIDRVAFCSAKEMTRPSLTGVLFKLEKGELTLACTDAYRLSQDKIKLENYPEELEGKEFIVPAKPVLEISKMVTNTSVDLEIRIPKGNNRILIYSENLQVSLQLIEGNYPDFTPIFPKDRGTMATINAKSLFMACKSTMVFAKESNGTVNLNLSKEDATLSFMGKSAETGDNETFVDVFVDGDQDKQIALNVAYLSDIASVLSDKEIVMEIAGPNIPFLVKCKEGSDDFRHLIMPMKGNY